MVCNVFVCVRNFVSPFPILSMFFQLFRLLVVVFFSHGGIDTNTHTEGDTQVDTPALIT